jgi:hypothetical protein
MKLPEPEVQIRNTHGEGSLRFSIKTFPFEIEGTKTWQNINIAGSQLAGRKTFNWGHHHHLISREGLLIV